MFHRLGGPIRPTDFLEDSGLVFGRNQLALVVEAISSHPTIKGAARDAQTGGEGFAGDEFRCHKEVGWNDKNLILDRRGGRQGGSFSRTKIRVAQRAAGAGQSHSAWPSGELMHGWLGGGENRGE